MWLVPGLALTFSRLPGTFPRAVGHRLLVSAARPNLFDPIGEYLLHILGDDAGTYAKAAVALRARWQRLMQDEWQLSLLESPLFASWNMWPRHHRVKASLASLKPGTRFDFVTLANHRTTIWPNK